ncbi:nibrin [Megalopta genalis]|uniref:nibrin n=1 Tax=Megalopta genalis TaxID=115081 RepID=UPI003FD4BBE8
MWYLLTSTGKRLYLQPTKEVTFGRKKSDILLQNDDSVSRLHATICVKPKDTVKPNEPISVCELKDNGSKYGTYIILDNEEKIEVTEEGYKLTNGDNIRFGLQQHVFTVVYVPLITIVSTLNDTEKRKLQVIFDQIDGMISTEWTTVCTHLTVSKASLTEKIAWAMASAVPIVSLNYWTAVKHAVSNGKELPNPTDFVPPLTESLIDKGFVSLCVNEKRTTLFRKLIFVYFSARQYKIYGKMVNMAGGKSVLYSKKPLTIKEICAPNVIVVQYSDGDTTQSTQGIVPEYETIYNTLKANKRNMITESDIVLAILHCSTERHCNPKFKFYELLNRSQSKPDSSNVLAFDTQDLTSDVKILPKVISNVLVTSNVVTENVIKKVGIIPESCSSHNILQSLDIMKSSLSKGIQITKIATDDITIERSTEKIKEIHPQKAVRDTSEINNSSQTQDVPKANTFTATQNTILNINDKIERVNKVSLQKAVKCIPETNDLSQSQDIISTPKINQNTKNTHNSNISNESKLPQGIKEVQPQKTVRCIPETNDLSQSQDIISTPKINQNTKNTHNSNISNESKLPQRIKEVHPQKTVRCIPETNDSSESQDIIGALKINQNTKSTHNSNISLENKLLQKMKEVHSRRTLQCISETNDSSQLLDTNGTPNTSQSTKNSAGGNTSIERKPAQRVEGLHSRMSQKCIPETNEFSVHKSQDVRKQNRNSHENDHMEESMIANKGTSLNDVINLADEDDDEEEAENKMEELLFSKLNASRYPENFLNQSKLDKLVHDSSARTHSPELYVSQWLVTEMDTDDTKKSRKRSNPSDEDGETSIRKKLCTSVTESSATLSETKNSAHTVKPSRAENHNYLPQNDTSLSSDEFVCKPFKKVPNKFVEQRITFEKALTWKLVTLSSE